MNRLYLDEGFDYNNDRHCDVEGWFVDRNGNHKPIIREYTNPEFGGPIYNNLADYFWVNGKFSGLNLSPLKMYSKNSKEELLSSPALNNHLRERNKSNKLINETITAIDKLINTHTLKKELHVFRGIGFNPNQPWAMELKNLRTGNIYYDLGFLSTSHSMEHALSYAMDEGNRNPILLEITLQPGTHCIPLYSNNESAYKEEEYEILVERELKLQVISNKIIKQDDITLTYIKMKSYRSIGWY